MADAPASNLPRCTVCHGKRMVAFDRPRHNGPTEHFRLTTEGGARTAVYRGHIGSTDTMSRDVIARMLASGVGVACPICIAEPGVHPDAWCDCGDRSTLDETGVPLGRCWDHHNEDLREAAREAALGGDRI